ncbi:MAG TPA: hypothetical protein DEA08_31875 [Planctomycetes bacterium]|nr:hypothetical protein [Planctomycetota bacterium]
MKRSQWSLALGLSLLLAGVAAAGDGLEPYLPTGITERAFRQVLESDLGSGLSGAVPAALLHAVIELEPGRFGESLPEAYARYGFQRLSGRELPVGIVEVRQLGVRAHQFNCLACHAGPGREGAEARRLIVGLTNHEIDFTGWYADVFGALRRLGEREARGVGVTPGSGEVRPATRALYVAQVATLLRRAAQRGLRRVGRRLSPTERLTLLAMAKNVTDDVIAGKTSGPGEDYGHGRTVVLQAYRSLRFGLPDGPYAPVKPPDLFGVRARKTLLWTASERYEGAGLWSGGRDPRSRRLPDAAERVARNGMLVPWIQLDPVRRKPIADELTLLRFPRYLRMGRVLSQATPPPAPAPRGPEQQSAFERGRAVFERTCAGCHGRYEHREAPTIAGDAGLLARVRDYPERVLPASEVGTDPSYVSANDVDFRAAFLGTTLGQARLFEPQLSRGYVARPLYGIRLRSPYLHNGSVPSLRALLTPPAQRPRGFYVGPGVPYDPSAVGLQALEQGQGPPRARWRDTTRAGNRASGHPFGTRLPAERKEDLLAYLRRL